jgi:uncharacterized protein YndB with AHSA1/START domain
MYTIILIIAIIIAFPFIIALFLKKDYVIETEVVINRPKHEVFDYLKIVENQEQYNKWVRTDPDMKKDLRGTDGTVGFVYAWNGNKKAGQGEQEITGITDGERITAEIRFERPFKNTAHTYQNTEAVTEHSTKVTWGMTGRSPYPMNVMTSLMKGLLRKDLAVSLNNLKNILENK